MRTCARHQSADRQVRLAVREGPPVEKSLGQRHLAGRQRRVHDDQAAETLGRFHGQCQAEEAAPILNHQRHVFQIEGAHECEQAVAMEIERVQRVVLRLVRAPEAEEVRRDHAASRRQKVGDHAPIEIAPGRLPVQAQKDWCCLRAFVEMRHREAGIAWQVASALRTKGKARQAVETFRRRSQDDVGHLPPWDEIAQHILVLQRSKDPIRGSGGRRDTNRSTSREWGLFMRSRCWFGNLAP